MQGTNAHAVLTYAPISMVIQLESSTLWQHHRYWHSPAPHQALHRAISAAGPNQAVTFQTMLSRPELSFLDQHALLGQRVLAAMAVAEMAPASGAMLKEDALEAPIGTFGCVWGARLVLQGHDQLQTTLQCGSGRFAVSCGSEELLSGVTGSTQVGLRRNLCQNLCENP